MNNYVELTEDGELCINLSALLIDQVGEDERIAFANEMMPYYDYIRKTVKALKTDYAGPSFNPPIHKLREAILTDHDFVPEILQQFVRAILFELASERDKSKRHNDAYWFAYHHACEECRRNHNLFKLGEYGPEYDIQKRADDVVDKMLQRLDDINDREVSAHVLPGE